MITAATWNVLHRIHAENWAEAAAEHWPDESKRIAAVTARVAELDEHAVALQEVSGDQLASLQGALTGRTVYAMRYPRVPGVRIGTSTLTDPCEYLVLVIRGEADQVAADAFDDDPGKGLLAVRTDRALVVATHVSFGRQQPRQLARLAELTAASAGPVVVLGDFNAARRTVAAGLGPHFSVAELPPGSPPTRPGGRTPHIDHVAVRGAAIKNVLVDSVDGLSDHNILRVEVTA
ncbi:endonuclease/exonuclease/phosphatase family protein [Embleya sp. NPDC001921]